MKRIILLLTLLISFSAYSQLNQVFIPTQLNDTTIVVDTINVATFDAQIDNKFRDSLAKYIFNPLAGRVIYKEFKRKFSKAIADSLNVGSYSADLNLLKTYNLIFSNNYWKKLELLVRIRAEHEPALVANDLYIAYVINGSKENGYITVGKYGDKNNTKGLVYLYTKAGTMLYNIDLKSVAKATQQEVLIYYK